MQYPRLPCFLPDGEVVECLGLQLLIPICSVRATIRVFDCVFFVVVNQKRAICYDSVFHGCCNTELFHLIYTGH